MHSYTLLVLFSLMTLSGCKQELDRTEIQRESAASSHDPSFRKQSGEQLNGAPGAAAQAFDKTHDDERFKEFVKLARGVAERGRQASRPLSELSLAELRDITIPLNAEPSEWTGLKFKNRPGTWGIIAEFLTHERGRVEIRIHNILWRPTSERFARGVVVGEIIRIKPILSVDMMNSGEGIPVWRLHPGSHYRFVIVSSSGGQPWTLRCAQPVSTSLGVRASSAPGTAK